MWFKSVNHPLYFTNIPKTDFCKVGKYTVCKNKLTIFTPNNIDKQMFGMIIYFYQTYHRKTSGVKACRAL